MGRLFSLASMVAILQLLGEFPLFAHPTISPMVLLQYTCFRNELIKVMDDPTLKAKP